MTKLTNAELDAVIPPTDPRLRLCDEMAVLRANYSQIERLIANKQWMKLAAALSNVEWAAKNAGYAVNDVLRPVDPYDDDKEGC